ncbi:MAG: 7-carboxy-7-deazaguanine synthase QueE [Actinomycetota bacterium]|nr:7-carboxy-7-deazaguanine synthase QueE [Actinomycetota bacterium]
MPEPRPAGHRATLLVAETFGDKNPTFQGEGPSCGTPAVFIRLSRCNLTCSWCDTKYTWDWEHYDPRKESARLGVTALAEWALPLPPGLVVITGGEPLLQQPKLALLVPRLLAAGKRVEVETNGTIAPDPALLADGVTFNVSPKLANSGVAEAKRIVPGPLEAFAASGRAVFKFVAVGLGDLDEIAGLAGRFGLDPVYVMPEAGTSEQLLDRTRILAGPAAARGWHFTTRLQVQAFDGARGL